MSGGPPSRSEVGPGLAGDSPGTPDGEQCTGVSKSAIQPARLTIKISPHTEHDTKRIADI